MDLLSNHQRKISDEEILYRRVRKDGYVFYNGKLRISSTAFNDRQKKPSVDRALLCNNDPCHTRVEPTDGIIALKACEIRNEKVIINNDNKETIYLIDVKSAPTETNLAHAEIVSNPDYKTNSPFEKLRIKLAALANNQLENNGWTLAPCNES